MKKFENEVIKFTPKPIFKDPIFLESIKRKKEIIFMNRPSEDDFIDIYGEEEVKKNKKEISRIIKSWENSTEDELNAKEVSDAYEAMIADQIGRSEWFGKDCKSYPVSIYDDIKNGIDIVTIFNKEHNFHYLGLGADVCFSSKKDELEEKLESIKQCIRSGSMPTLKYFKNPETGEKKKIFLPKVIIGSRFSSAEKLLRIWGGKNEIRDKELKENPIQSKLILETISQLMYFYNFAKNLSENNPDRDLGEKQYNISLEYGRMYNYFYDIYLEKEELINKHLNEISDDIVYETILNYTGSN